MNKPEVNHIDGNKRHNIRDNLEWSTTSENFFHADQIGLLADHKRVRPIVAFNAEGSILFPAKIYASTDYEFDNNQIMRALRRRNRTSQEISLGHIDGFSPITSRI